MVTLVMMLFYFYVIAESGSEESSFGASGNGYEL